MNSKIKWLIVLTVMLLATLEVLDSTIVTVALPNMMGSLEASSDQITWVLTSYIVASAIFMPLTGFLVARLGRRNLLLTNAVGFMVSSMACGLTNNFEVMVLFRVLQGAFGAALIPVSQAVMQDTFTQEEQPKAMAIWGIGIMVAPVLGPTIGGYIIDNSSWRWIFYLNAPICLIAVLLTLLVIKQTKRTQAPIDWLGMFLMATGIGCLQIFLDQGNQKGWLTSNFILSMLSISIVALFIFIVRGIKKPDNVINLRLFLDKNFTASTIMLALFAGALFSTVAIQPIMLEHLMNYPAITTGELMAPRGIASAVAMAMSAGLMSRVNVKYILLTAIAFSAYGTYLMSGFNLNMSLASQIFPTVLQGFGMGLFFPPIAACALATLPKASNDEGAGLFGYGRMLGMSIGISVLSTIITRETQVNWNQLTGHIQGSSIALQHWLASQGLSLDQPAGVYQLGNTVARQAQMIAYIDGYWAIALAFIALVPFVFMLGKIDVSEAGPMGH